MHRSSRGRPVCHDLVGGATGAAALGAGTSVTLRVFGFRMSPARQRVSAHGRVDIVKSIGEDKIFGASSPVLGLGDPRLAVVGEALDEQILERAPDQLLET
jgi:hypothetical protein